MKNGEYNLVIAPDNYPGKKYRGKYCSEHTLVYWENHGVIPNENQVIHHLDGNKRNNNINNLLLMEKKVHSRNHSSTGQTFLRLKCPGCGKEFVTPKSKTHFYVGAKVACCSRKCIGMYTKLSEDEKENRKQANIIEEFKVYK